MGDFDHNSVAGHTSRRFRGNAGPVLQLRHPHLTALFQRPLLHMKHHLVPLRPAAAEGRLLAIGPDPQLIRPPDAAGQAYWVSQVAAGLSLEELSGLFAASPEFVARYPLQAAG